MGGSISARELDSRSKSVSPAVITLVSVQQVQRWIDRVNASPAETLKKATLRQLLKS